MRPPTLHPSRLVLELLLANSLLLGIALGALTVYMPLMMGCIRTLARVEEV